MTNTTDQKAVIYCRVSSKKQKTEGHGLESQEARCREYAGYKGYQVVAVFMDDMTGAAVKRPAMTAMLSMLKSQRRDPHVVIIDDITRLARDIDAHRALRKQIAAAGGILESPNMEFGDDPEKELVENISASVSHHHRRANARQTVNRMRARMAAGYWVFHAPIGFRFQRVAGHGKLMVRAEPEASIIAEAFESFASGRFQTLSEVSRFLANHPDWPRADHVTVERVIELFNRPHYAGVIDRPDWGIHLQPAKHEAIISFATYQAVHRRMNVGAHAPARVNHSEDFPMRGFVTCADCNNPLTSCWSKGRSAKYAYYLCQTKGCPSRGKSIRREQLEGDFEALLRELRPTRSLFMVGTDVFRTLWDNRSQRLTHDRKSIESELRKVERDTEQMLDRLVETDSQTLIQTYERRIRSLEERKAELREKVSQCGKPLADFETTYRTAMTFLGNPWKLWDSPRYEDKRAVLKMVFTERLPYRRGKGYRTAATSLPFEVFRLLDKPQSEMVRAVGIEPTLLSEPDFESGASTSFTTPARLVSARQ